MGENFRFAQLIGCVVHDAPAAPGRGGDEGVITGDRLRVMSIVISNIDFADAGDGLDFEGDFGLGDPGELSEEFGDVVCQGMGLDAF